MYLSGFGAHHQSEAIPNALPLKQNAPQHPPFNLYAEQLSGSAFTRTRHKNLHTWVYRTHPSAMLHDYKKIVFHFKSAIDVEQSPNPMRWSPFANHDTSSKDFLNGIFHVAGNQHNDTYIYQCNASMHHDYFNNRDGELLFIPYQGTIRLRTELGRLEISPGYIAVIPRGITFAVDVLDGPAMGYLCENRGQPFTLPELGVVGANGLANPRHFMYPKACIEEKETNTTIICKYQDKLWASEANHTPLNVIAWQGTYAPYCYDLSLFNTLNTVSFDHPDPSIFTVLTSESEIPGIANLDFVIFPPRWMVAEHTFRPPYFHRNIMSELMGLIEGEYDAKKTGFMVGGVSVHNCMTNHGPDLMSYQHATRTALKPVQYKNTLAFMLESRDPWLITEQAMQHPARQLDYTRCWQGFTEALSETDTHE